MNFKDLQGVESSDYGNNSVQGRSAKEVKIAKPTLSLFSCEQPGIKSQNKRERNSWSFAAIDFMGIWLHVEEGMAVSESLGESLG